MRSGSSFLFFHRTAPCCRTFTGAGARGGQWGQAAGEAAWGQLLRRNVPAGPWGAVPPPQGACSAQAESRVRTLAGHQNPLGLVEPGWPGPPTGFGIQPGWGGAENPNSRHSQYCCGCSPGRLWEPGLAPLPGTQVPGPTRTSWDALVSLPFSAWALLVRPDTSCPECPGQGMSGL